MRGILGRVGVGDEEDVLVRGSGGSRLSCDKK